jgi:hypothetical protein
MKIDISEYYKKKGFSNAYVVVNKEQRRIALLRKPNREMTSMSYAKYLYTSHYKCDVAEGDQVDHINGDKMDDRIENLQVISGKYNAVKDKRHKEMVELICPVCKERFLFPKRNLSTHPNPCCSRRCGGKKSHWH